MHPFRFGVIAAPYGSAEQWQARARRIADEGFGTLLTPDGVGLHEPFVALATAAAAVPQLRVGTFVVAAPLRAPREVAWQAHSLSVLSGGRFDFGIGTGRPDAEAEAQSFDRPWGTGSSRLAVVRESIAALRERDGDSAHTPVLMAAGGPKALALAAAEADIVALPATPATPPEAVAAMAQQLRDHAGARAESIEVALNLFLVGDELEPWMRAFGGADPAQLHRNGSTGAVHGTPRQMADQLLRRRDEFGVNYYALGEGFVEALAPVAEILAGE